MAQRAQTFVCQYVKGECSRGVLTGLGGVAGKTTDIGSDHGNLKDGGEVQDTSDTEAVLLPGADVITEPFAYISAETDELDNKLAKNTHERR